MLSQSRYFKYFLVLLPWITGTQLQANDHSSPNGGMDYNDALRAQIVLNGNAVDPEQLVLRGYSSDEMHSPFAVEVNVTTEGLSASKLDDQQIQPSHEQAMQLPDIVSTGQSPEALTTSQPTVNTAIAQQNREGGLTLQSILQRSLVVDAKMHEARASERAAQSRAEASFARHFPTLAVQSNQLLAQQQKKGDDKSTRFEPTLVGRLNLYSWGAIQHQYERDKEKERYFYYKFYETREELGNEIATYYLTALYDREILKTLRRNLERHEKILADINVIVRNDKGRRSEWVQARAREVQVRQSIATYEASLQVALSKLSKYTGHAVAVRDLIDPFFPTSVEAITAYRRDNIASNATYMAQQAEWESARAEHQAVRARQLPAINLEAAANRNAREIYLNVSWDLFDRSTAATVDAGAQDIVVAQARLDQVLRDIEERTRTSQTQMEQSLERLKISKEQIEVNQDVVRNYELQFKIARKTLIELLNAYNDLSSVEMAAVNARHDFRNAAMSYLRAQDKIAIWAHVPASEWDQRYEEDAFKATLTAPLVAD